MQAATHPIRGPAQLAEVLALEEAYAVLVGDAAALNGVVENRVNRLHRMTGSAAS